MDKGVITAKSEGKVTIAAIQTYNSLLDNNLFAVVTVVPNQSEGKTPQVLSESNFEGFTEKGVAPSIKINSADVINNKSKVTNAKSLLEGKVSFIGEPIEVSTTAEFDWADISFTLSEEQLNGIDINDLTIYWYDVESNAIVPQVTKIDEASRRLTTTVTHFSPYFIGMKDYTPIDIAFVIDNYYGDSNSISIFQSNIAKTIIELRKHTDVRASFIFRDENKEVDVWDRTYKKIENPTDIDDDAVWYTLYNVFLYIRAFDNELTNEDDIIRICSEASTKGYEILTSKEHFPTLAREAKKYVLVYTRHNGYFIESNSIYLAMPKAYGIVIGNTKGYYQDAAFAYNIDNVIPLASFLIEPVYSQLTLTKTGNYVWVLKEGNANVTEDVIVLQKTLVSKGYLVMPLDENGNMVPFGCYASITKNAVHDF